MAKKAIKNLNIMPRDAIVGSLNRAKDEVLFILNNHQTLTDIGQRHLKKIIEGIEDFKTQIAHSA